MVKRLISIALFGFVAALVAVSRHALAETAFAVSPVPSRFGLLDLQTGAFSAVGPAPASQYVGIATIGSSILAGYEDGRIVSINPFTGIPTPFADSHISLFALAGGSGGELYALDNALRLYSLNPTTGAPSLIGATNLPQIQSISASAFAASSANIYYTYEDGSHPSTLYTLNRSTGLATAIGPTTNANQILGAGFIGTTLYGFTGPRDPRGPSMYALNTSNGAAAFVANTPVVIWGAAVPEPSSLVLAAVAAATLAWLARARTRSARSSAPST
jgi:hypothetical protein